MIICSCTVITDKDIEQAVLEIMSVDNAPLPTPGIVYRHLSKKMNCCSCAPIAVSVIYKKVEELEKRGLICPCACQTARSKLLQLKPAAALKAEKQSSGKEAFAEDISASQEAAIEAA